MINKKKYIAMGLLSITISIVAVGYTVSSFTSKDTVINNFKVADLGIKIYEKDENWNEANGNWEDNEGNWSEEGKESSLGGTITKKVKVKNINTADAFIRVTLHPRWVDENGEPWMGDTGNIKFNLNESSNWTDKEEDGYYYYKPLVKSGEFTNELLREVQLNINDENFKNRYEGKTLIIDVKAEAVVAVPNETYDIAWNNSIGK